MKKEILIFGIIFLFIGVGIQPAFAIDISNSSPSENIDECNCQIVDNYKLVRVKSLLNRAENLLNRVEIYTILITTLSKDNPEFIKDCEELSEKIMTFKEMNEELKTALSVQDYPIICFILIIMGFAITLLLNVESLIANLLYIIFQNIPIIANFIVKIHDYCFIAYLRILDHIVVQMIFYECDLPTGIIRELKQKILIN